MAHSFSKSGRCKYTVLNPILTSGNAHDSATQVSAIMCSVLMTAQVALIITALPPQPPIVGISGTQQLEVLP